MPENVNQPQAGLQNDVKPLNYVDFRILLPLWLLLALCEKVLYASCLCPGAGAPDVSGCKRSLYALSVRCRVGWDFDEMTAPNDCFQ
jgi:hypothetical protein